MAKDYSGLLVKAFWKQVWISVKKWTIKKKKFRNMKQKTAQDTRGHDRTWQEIHIHECKKCTKYWVLHDKRSMNKRWIKAAVRVMVLEAEWVYNVHTVPVIIITFRLCYCHLIWHSTMSTFPKAFRGIKSIRFEAEQRQVWVNRTGRQAVTLSHSLSLHLLR